MDIQKSSTMTGSTAVASATPAGMSPRSGVPSISVVAPAYNEQEVIEEFHRRVTQVLTGLNCDYEIVLVNDGSKDRTLELMHALHAKDPHITIVDLSRNFGKEIALSAGLDHTKGEVVVILDSDLQDPPELIPQMLEGWREGYEVVYGVRLKRDGETWLKKASASAFYRLIQRVSRVRIPRNTGDFRLMTRRAILEMGKLREQHRFMKGLFAWIGFPSKPMYYSREPRVAGETKWNYWSLWNLAVEGITSFSTAPLKIATYLGLTVAFISLIFVVIVIWKTLKYGESVQGYPSMMVVILFLGGVQLISIGVLGEYIGRIFNEVKMRPLYLVNQTFFSGLLRSDPHTPASEKTTNEKC